MTPASAVKAIERAGLLLVFPIANSPQFPSLWSHFFPRSKMRWEWDDAGDHRVADLWHLREELSRSGQVVYTKWFRGRATFFSRSLFPALIRSLHGDPPFAFGLKSEAETLLRLLEENSPLSTKQLKRASEMEGRFFESAFQRALKELWAHLLIVGYGEVDPWPWGQPRCFLRIFGGKPRWRRERNCPPGSTINYLKVHPFLAATARSLSGSIRHRNTILTGQFFKCGFTRAH
jgi:hypothetical protein